MTLVLWNNQLTHTGMAFLGMALVSPGLFIGLVLPAHACLITLLCVCVCVPVCMWRAEDTLKETAFSFSHV